MAVSIEISYFNSIVIAGGQLNYTNGGSPGTHKPGVYHIEENRIKGEFNGKQMDYGAKAYITNEKYRSHKRPNAMIYSGIFNARTDFNELNQFPVGEEISRAVDISHGSIQKLYAEETNLNIFQENKVSRALIDKDIIFTAEGVGLSTAGKRVISQITPYTGKYGISKNPESFAVFGNRKYFADKNRGVVMRLSAGKGGGQGLTPISAAGMKDFFKDHLVLCDKIYGAYDEQKGKYVISLQGSSIDGGKIAIDNSGVPGIQDPATGYRTLCYDDRVQGWTSFFTYKPTFGLSLKNEFYTYNNVDLYKHYDTSVAKGTFYGATFADPSYIKFVFNQQPGTTKTFATINYEGTTGWEMDYMKASGSTAPTDLVLEAYKIPKEGTLDGTTAIGFIKKEDKYFSEIRNKATDFFNDNKHFNSTGVKGYYVDVTMQYWGPTASASSAKQELFSVGSEVLLSSK
jgi:hypothetical protein|tara:strand:+ start:2088 stop:3461 length:1374 start_codon:yes stop_codon:yes gene_type:complete